MRKWKILLVDDEAWYRDAVQLRLEQEGYEVLVAESAAEARGKLATPGLDLAILDLRLNDNDPQDYDGLEIAASEAPGIPKIVMTKHTNVEIETFFSILGRRGMPPEPPVFKQGENGGLDKLLLRVKSKLVPRVFIAHGHDREWRDRVRDRVRQMGLVPVILADAPAGGDTVIEQLERAAERVHFAVVLLTGCDQGYPTGKPEKLKLRARQNVIFELGWFVAALGRSRVVALCEPEVEIPSNFLGVRYFDLDPHGDWRERLPGELRKGGIDVDLYRSAAAVPGEVAI
jgi:CheY-like chemotaxis protein